jgi:ketosteroid isomerase-like protein
MAGMTTKAPEKTANAAEVARSYFEAVARQDLDAMEAHYDPSGEGPIHGLVHLRQGDNYRPWFENLFRAFPNWTFEVLNLIGDEEMAAVEWRATATFNGSAKFEGMEPNGASLEVQGCDVVTVREGRIVHLDAYSSGTEIARQLGALPPQGSPAEKAMTAALNLKTRAVKALRRN